MSNKQSQHFIAIALLLCLLPLVNASIALLLGLFYSILKVDSTSVRKHTSNILQISIILLGFGMNLSEVISTSLTGFHLTLFSVIGTLGLGLLLGKIFRIDLRTTLLISSGTAICGGSAIAAVAPVIQAKNKQIVFAMAVVFVLNAIALLIFPYLGHYFHLNQERFGLWSAIAIHDTSSVVGAASVYGEEALKVATTTKLTRALWIIPISILMALFTKQSKKIKFPFFILLFVLAILFCFFFPQFQNEYMHLQWLGRKGLCIALFLVGSSISMKEIKSAGFKSFLLGILLWFAIGSTSLFYLLKP